MIALALTGPQAARVVATADTLGLPVDRVVTRLGRCFSARRETVSLAPEDAVHVMRVLAVVASYAALHGENRAAAETLATAKLIETALASIAAPAASEAA